MAVQAYNNYSCSDPFLGFSFCGSMESTGDGFNNELFQSSLFLPQQQYQHMIQNQFLGQVVNPLENNNIPSSSSMGFSQSALVSSFEKKQRQEVDEVIALQNERLRVTLQEQRKQQQLILLKKLESKAQSLLRQKDEDLAKARRKTMELEDYIRKFETENQAWQRVAQENESMVIALNNTLEQVRENTCYLATTSVEDAESCCCEPSSSFSINNAKKNEERRLKKKVTCKGCNSQISCVVLLPCRHLCSCKSCESLLDFCPVCKSVKKGSMDVFMA
ncbi:E3 ubiquitin-protein ligase boi [Thalictrum thalictroides]|uniref:E3 ubiquitin-protein ligase boi n=1 Tax=Thalictrum thalictroides TaxID=46969 RepID=A0A7J6WD34_THATH|nr:E3 ubiquitin-protein ligase boi [Thalictrum thalictroides]